MVSNIDWDEFKEFRKTSKKEQDNFMYLLDFLKSYYNMVSIEDFYYTLSNDETSKMMLAKRNITNSQGIEKYLFR